MWADYLPSEPPGKPLLKVCASLFLFYLFFRSHLCDMWNFPEQGLNLGSLHWNCVVLTIGPSGKSRDFCCLVSFLEIMLGKPALRNVIFKQIYRRVLILEHLRLKSLLLPTQSRLHPERGPAHQHVLCDARKALSGDASRFVPERSRMGGKEKSKNKHC